jgi:diguanylate cyclase (GGDEF)-like protein
MNEEKKNSLLIVDDEKSNLQILTHILESEYTIFTATNGISAIEKARKFLPDIILLDIIMPEMDGYQTLSEIKKCEELYRIPVVFITSLNNVENEEKGLALEAADYIAKPFSANVVKLRVRNQIQMINQIRTIEQMGMIDQLTNIPNRRSFDSRLGMEWNQAIREQTPISILMMDLDGFKEINDTYGHQQGDNILQTISKIFTNSLKRPGDFTARWGGEEFVVLLPNTPLSGALEVAENIRLDVENTEILFARQILKITISIGVNSQVPTKDCLISDFIALADKALYDAKQAGKNKVSNH